MDEIIFDSREENLFDNIKLYEDLILAELLEGKTKEEIVATLQSGSRIDYDENFILRNLMEGKTREEIATILKHKSFRTLDMFMRRRGYRWDGEKQTYVLESQKVSEDYDSISSSFNVTDDQVLQFTINGKSEAADLEALEAAGYVVTFNTDKKVLSNGETVPAATTTNTTGAILNSDFLGASSAIKSFQYEVVVTKEGKEVAKSELVTVNVLNGVAFTSIDKVSLTIASDIVVNSGKIEMNDTTPTLKVEEGTLVNGTTEQAITGAKYESLNKTVALINETSGVITPISEGKVTFKITKDNAVKEVSFTVVNDADDRYVATVTADKTSIDMTTSTAKIDVKLTLVDQFGDAIKGDLPEIAAVQNADKKAITNAVDPAAATIDADGNATVTVSIVPEGTNTGSGTLKVVDANGKAFLSISVNVGNGTTISSRKLENTASDSILDVVSADDKELVLNYNKYNEEGQFIGIETDIATDDTKTYKVVSSKPATATVAADTSGNITVTAVAKGTSTIKVMEGSVVRASFDVEVIDTTPILTSVVFNDKAKITEAGAYALSNVVTKIEDENGKVLYVKDDLTINTKEDGTGLEVGTVEFITIDLDSVKLSSGNIQYGASGSEADPKAEDNGTIIVKVLDNSGKTVGLFELVVAVPAE